MNIKDIKSNPNNPRIIKDEKFEKLKKSIKEFPKMMALRPMVINQDNIVLGGNMRLKALKELGYTELPDEWVKRAEDLTDEEARRFIIADNVGFGEHDWDLLANEWDAEELADWGLEGFPFEDIQENNLDNEYTKKIESPNYEPKEDKPEIVDLYNIEKYTELINKIEYSNIEEDIKEFLKVTASRHIVFNYSNIADFYSHSNKEVQEIMEDLALVIIDFNKAIENGYVELTETIKNNYMQEYGE